MIFDRHTCGDPINWEYIDGKVCSGDNLYVQKIRNVKEPRTGTPQSSGYDLFIPELDKGFRKKFEELNGSPLPDNYNKITLSMFTSVLIPLGIKVNLPKGYDMKLVNRSGFTSRTGAIVGACLIDNDYQGEIILNLINPSNNWIDIKPNKSYCQAEIRRYYKPEMLFKEGEIYNEITKRNQNGFGHTDGEEENESQ